jgi:hypothetical protein
LSLCRLYKKIIFEVKSFFPTIPLYVEFHV